MCEHYYINMHTGIFKPVYGHNFLTFCVNAKTQRRPNTLNQYLACDYAVVKIVPPDQTGDYL